MEEHGTAFPSWYITFQQAVLAALPRPPKLDQETSLNWADNGKVLSKVLAKALLPEKEQVAPSIAPTVRAYPAEGEIFELTLDGDAPENDPVEMVRRDGYNSPEGWQYTGKKLTGKQTRRFKLVKVGYCQNFNELWQKLQPHGTIPEGHWREAFEATYPQPDGNGPVGFADPSWVNPRGNACFPYVNTNGNSHFGWTDDDFHEHWRWVVVVGNLRSFPAFAGGVFF